MKRPTTYVEWRAVYQQTIYWLGLAALSLHRFRALNAPDFMRHDAARLERRLAVEHEAMDETLCEEIMRLCEDEP